MSIWTHVVGCIRIDGLPKLSPEIYNVNKIKELIGPMCLFDEWNEDSKLPCGSEGSLEYDVIEYGTGMTWVSIPIWGDLRGYDNVNEIKNWFLGLVELFGDVYIVRDGVIKIQVEGEDPVIVNLGE